MMSTTGSSILAGATAAAAITVAAAITAALTASPLDSPPSPARQDDGAGDLIVRHPDPAQPLPKRWEWAAAEGSRKDSRGGYWIGYSIDRMMGERSFIGSFYSDEGRNRPSLRELLTGKHTDDVADEAAGSPGSPNAIRGKMNFRDNGKPVEPTVRKEVAILFRLPGGGSSAIDEIEVSNVTLRVDLEGRPLYWLGHAEPDESVALLETGYGRAATTNAREEFLMAIGLHTESPRAFAILKRLLREDGDTDVREAAAFWLGETGTEEARKILAETAWEDNSEQIREKAIFSLSRMDGEAALEELISLARKHRDPETRKQAAFWLGQQASEKAVGVLKELAYSEEDTDLQRNAMFALAQADEGGAVDELIRIARTHPNPKIRKEAIFWLGQSGDERAVEALVEMVRGR